MMSAPWDNAARQRYKEYTQLLIALVLGAIVLLPTLVGLSKPPVTWPWAVPLSILRSLVTYAARYGRDSAEILLHSAAWSRSLPCCSKAPIWPFCRRNC